jgi:hypothetical protein
MAANEFVMSGRDAITNLEMPFMEYINTSMDTEEQKNWDRFGAGFNIQNYPETKKAIIKKILDMSMGKAGNLGKREEAAQYYKTLLDKKTFKNKVYGLLK